jgi:SAM-dependent methyltransferase
MTTPLRREIYSYVAQAAQAAGQLRPDSVVGDFGCAAGDFLFYLHAQAPQARLFGYDLSATAIDQAQSREQARLDEFSPAILFRPGSVLDKALLPAASLDVAFMLGVHPYFDEIESALANLLAWTRSGGYVAVFGLFNPYPIDVRLSYRPVGEANPGESGRGWNLFAKAAVSRYLDAALGPGQHRFTPFIMPYDLPPDPDNPGQSWTIMDGNGRRWLTNGLSLLLNQELLEIWPS